MDKPINTQKKVPAIRFQGFSGEWEERTLGEVFNYHRPDKYIVKSTDYSDKYSTPVLTANKGFLLGYTNEKSTFDMPSIIFDDFTLDSKYIDFPYMVKSSAIKILTIKNERTDSLIFAFNLLNNTKLEAMGHARHYISIVQKTQVVLPNIKEQTQIGNFFQALDDLIAKREQKHVKLGKIKQALLGKLFPQAGETVPQMRFIGFSGEWEEKTLGEVADIVGGGTPSTFISEYWNGDINWYSPTEIGDNRFVIKSKKKITELGLQKSSAKILPAHKTILFTSRASIGDMAVLKADACTNQGFQSLVTKDGHYPYFLYSYGFLIKKYALTNASGSTFLEISGKQLGKMPIKLPTRQEQTQIGNLFHKLDTLINQYEQQITTLKNIKQGYLNKMFI